MGKVKSHLRLVQAEMKREHFHTRFQSITDDLKAAEVSPCQTNFLDKCFLVVFTSCECVSAEGVWSH